MTDRAYRGPSERAASMPSFMVMDILDRGRQLEAAGRDIVHLEIGEPDSPTPPSVIEAAVKALRDGHSGYSPTMGLPGLRQAISSRILRTDGVEISPERIVITSGSSPALFMALSSVVDPGDEVIICDPCYPCYPNHIRFLGGLPVMIPTTAQNGYLPDPGDIRDAITPRTTALIVNSPANPTGAVIPSDLFRSIADLCDAAGICLISDEIYSGMVYDGESPSALRFDTEAFVLSGFSKLFSMPGWRLGYAVVPERFLPGVRAMQQNLFLSAGNFIQIAAVTALEDPETESRLARLRGEYRRRRDFAVTAARECGLAVPNSPAGAFYLMVDARPGFPDSPGLARALLEDASVAVAAGLDFGPSAEGHFRISYATSMEQLHEGMTRISGFFGGSR